MTMDMDDNHLESVAQLAELVKLSQSIKCTSVNRPEAYEWIGRTLSRFRYVSESKKNKGIIKRYLINMTGYSEAQIDKLIRRKMETGKVFLKERTQHTFPVFYEARDIILLAEVMRAGQYQNGRAIQQTLRDMYLVYKDLRFERLQHISVAHIYNLKQTRIYQSHALEYTKTRPVAIPIGERRKPQPCGKPGFIRVDSVHQGDLDREKGVYHINLVDEITQWELVGCVASISEAHLAPLLEELLTQLPFTVVNFHSDNGSEYINYVVARLLGKLLVHQTKSRARHCNDNALAESKNGAVVRKFMGYAHIPKKYAVEINQFYQEYLNPYLNFHRYCAFPTEYMDIHGKIRKKYETYLTPCQKLLGLDQSERYLKPGVNMRGLNDMQKSRSHFAAAQELQKAKTKLFTRM